MRTQYKYEDLDCTLCNDMVDAGCPHLLCPHAMENLKDLQHDPAFIDAVDCSEILLTPLTPTLRHLHKTGFLDDLPERLQPYPLDQYSLDENPECAGCPYPHVGLPCISAVGSCVELDYIEALKRSRKPCPA